MTYVVTVVLPALNEESALPVLLDELQRCAIAYPQYDLEVIVVNDNSTDATGSAVASFRPTSENFLVGLRDNIVPSGKTQALATGIRAAREDSELLAFLDADGQHSPVDLFHMLSRVAKTNETCIARRANYRRHGLSRAGTKALTFASRLIGSDFDQSLAEFAVMDRTTFLRVRESPQLGLQPLLPLLLSVAKDPVFQIVAVREPYRENRSRVSTRSLVQKAIGYLLFDPLRIVSRLAVFIFLVTSVLGSYGLFIGISSVLDGTFLGIGSVIVVLVIIGILGLNLLLLLVLMLAMTMRSLLQNSGS